MSKTLRLIARGGLLSKLELWSTAPAPRHGSVVAMVHTEYRDADGKVLGDHTMRLDPIDKGWCHEFRMLCDTAEPDEAHSSLWL